jgi:hypothetical protein
MLRPDPSRRVAAPALLTRVPRPRCPARPLPRAPPLPALPPAPALPALPSPRAVAAAPLGWRVLRAAAGLALVLAWVAGAVLSQKL